MIFSTASFLLFFIFFFLLYWFVFNKNTSAQNYLLLAGSYFFYGWWDWRLLLFLVTYSLLVFVTGIKTGNTEHPKKKRFFLVTGLCICIGALFFFKYYNFFVLSLKDALHAVNVNFHITTLHIIIPLGISFLSFRAISYLLDIDKGKLKPTTDWVIFFNYLAFFPTVLSGPIDKAKTFIPQLEKKRMFDYNRAADGLRQITWGLFKKLVIADNCASITDSVFNDFQSMPGSTLLAGAFFYTIQIYADFSGYSDMAIGLSRLLGFEVTKNFNYPFFSRNIADFWRRWHISLTTWLTEYIFTPLTIAFRDYGNAGLIAAVLINFTLIGLWHGPSWTFILFGFLHGCFFIPLILKGTLNKRIKTSESNLPSTIEFLRMTGTFLLVMFSFILFRSPTIADAMQYYRNILSPSLFHLPIIPSGKRIALTTLFFIAVMSLAEWLQRNREYALQFIPVKQALVRITLYYILIFIIIWFSADSANPFIYFKF
jgi:alginate O-acetyltransferase complex protein AlgI